MSNNFIEVEKQPIDDPIKKIQPYPVPEIEPFFEWEYGFQDTYPFFFVPELPSFIEQDFKGISYAEKNYTWEEIDYRMNVDYPTVPEPADAGFFMAIVVGALVAFCYFKSKIKS